MKKLIITLFILSPLVILYACSPQKSYDIIVSDYFTYDFVKEITGDALEIQILQPIHMDYHSYEPSSRDLVDLKKAKLFIYTSIAQSPWLGSEANVAHLLKDGTFTSLELQLNLSHSHHEIHDDHDHDVEDEHHHGFDFISNPFYVADIVENLTQYLSEHFPVYSDDFQQNGNAYKDKLINLITPYEIVAQNQTPKKIYYIGHNALDGFKDAFNLEITYLDESISPNSDATSNQVANFIKAIKDESVTTIYTHEAPNISTINYIKSKITGITILELHTFHKISAEDFKQNIGYYDLIERNLKTLEMKTLI